MSKQICTMGTIKQFRYLILGLVIFSNPVLQAYGAGVLGTKGGGRQTQDSHFTPNAKDALQGLLAEPYALKFGSGKTNVRFTVKVPGPVDAARKVYLHRAGDHNPHVMNDEGRDGDPVAKDGVYGKDIVVDATGLKPDTCLHYEAYTQSKKGKNLSSAFKLCASAFPIQIAPSDATRQVKFSDGSKAISDEILLTASPNANSDTIRRAAKGINASIVGTIPALRLYQLKLGSQVSGSQFPELVRRLQSSSGVLAVSLNQIGTFASSDTHFPSQHGLQQMRAQDVWGSVATGTGVTVVVLDSGLELTHTDLVPSWTCQLPGSPALVPCTDTVGHGTMVAGVVAAVTDNLAGVAGVAYGSNIHSIKVNSTPNSNDPTHPFVLLGDMQQAFNEAATYVGARGLASVINASFSVQVSTFSDVTTLCQSINNVVMNGAVVANAAGNDNSNLYFYPGRCNINEPAGQPHAGQNEALVAKNRFISVANSVSLQNPDCMVNGLVGGIQNAINSRCEGYNNAINIRVFGSNYGTWVDLAAPGARIYTTSIGGGYAEPTGTSFSSPMVAGAAAILESCGVGLDQIETTLRMTTNPIGKVNVTFPDASSAPRLDIYLALKEINHAPTSVSPASFGVNEGSPANTLIGTLNANDVDTCDKLTYSITGANLGGFTIDANTGVLRVGGVALDYDGVPSHSYTLTVQVTDFFGLTSSQLVTVNLNNLNDTPPVITSNGGGASASISVPENTTAVTTVTYTDADNLGALSYSLTDADAGVFSISSSGVLTFNSAPNFEAPADAGANNVYNFTVQVTDGANIDSQAITVTVTNASEAPTGVPIVNPDPATIANRTVSQPLTANTSLVYNPDSWTISSYQWRRSGSNIPGETAITHTLDSDDVGLFMSFSVTYTDGVLPPATLYSGTDAIAVGDPHITTVDGLRYDFQGAGEFVALRGANGMEIQLRMAPVSSAPPLPDEYTGLTSGASVNTAVAARVGKHSVSYQPDTSANAAANTFVLRVDGVPKTLPLPAGGIDLGDGGRVLPHAEGLQIDFPDQTTLMINNNWGTFYGASWLQISVFHTSAYDGIMGARSKGSWLPRLSDGSSFGAKPASLHDRYVELYLKFADSWRVNKDTTLFYYDDGTSTATFTNRAWPTENGPYSVGNEPVAKPLGLRAAQLACRDVVGKNEKANCIFDVRVLGHADLAKGHLLNQKIRLGAVNVVVRGADKLNARGEMVVTATVARHATVVPKVKGLRNVPAGTVQFMLGDKALGKPVKLDEKGQAKLAVSRLNLERFNVGKLPITARYMPVRDKANVFLPSISRQLTRELVGLK